jgi:hypothetical protein
MQRIGKAIDGAQFLLAGGDGGQVPARRRRLAANALPAVQDPAAEQDAADGAQRGQGLCSLLRPVNGRHVPIRIEGPGTYLVVGDTTMTCP